jgi:3'(2'), 5'-bisphosphate nucleotidase
MKINDNSLSLYLAKTASSVLRDVRKEHGNSLSYSELKDFADDQSQKTIDKLLKKYRPNDFILSEEAKFDDINRISSDSKRVWIIDPLDGTNEFAEKTNNKWRDDFAVHIALWDNLNKDFICASVAIPSTDKIWSTFDSKKLVTNASNSKKIRIAVSRSHRAKIGQFFMKYFNDFECIPIGSAGVKTVSVLNGTVDAYIHDGGFFEWDTAAPVAVAKSKGLIAKRLNGSELTFNNKNVYVPDLYICTKNVKEKIENAIKIYLEQK